MGTTRARTFFFGWCLVCLFSCSTLPAYPDAVSDLKETPAVDASTPADQSPDGAAPECTGCTSSQVCNLGHCVDVPKKCPCPSESYCDLGSNTCIIGCTQDDQCSSNRFCDTGARQCKPGCRSVADCPDDGNLCTTTVCNKGACQNQPNTLPCADDGNKCTGHVCSGGACTHPPVSDGLSCGADSECGSPLCKTGACQLTPRRENLACTDDGNKCTGDTCKLGTCVHPTLPDYTFCGGTMDDARFQQCFSGTCTPAKAFCNYDSKVSYYTMKEKSGATYMSWGQNRSCECIGGTLMLSYFAGMPGTGAGYHTEICSTSCTAYAPDMVSAEWHMTCY